MTSLRTLPRLHLILIVLIVVGAVAYLFLSRGNASAQAERGKLDLQLKAAQARLSSAQSDVDLEALRAELEQARSALPGEAEAWDVGNQLWQNAVGSGLEVERFDSSHTSPGTPAEGQPAATEQGETPPAPGSAMKSYPAVINSIEAQGEAASIVAFLQGLTLLTPSPVVQALEITEQAGEEGIWHLKMELASYYSDS